MPEIEVKILNIDINAIRRNFKKMGSKLIHGPTIFREYYFEIPGIKKRERKFYSFRLRTEGKKHILCAKTDKADKRYQVSQEVEIEVSDAEETKSLLNLLGFNIFRQREKIREEYHFENIKVAIDKYPNMAPYIEIEGKKKRDVINFVKKIGYKAQDMTNETATDLIRKAKMNPDYLFFPKINKE